MRNQVIVHRVVKNTKRTGQYIEPHSHAFVTTSTPWAATPG